MIIALLSILIISIFLGLIFNKKTVECLPMAIFGITFTMYLFGIINMMIIALIIIACVTIAGIIFIIQKILKDKKKIFKLIDVGTIVFIGLILITFFIVKGSKVICYDEFTAWGMHVKTSFESKTLYIYSEYQALAKHYASGTSIFQTFMQFCNFRFSEDLLFMAMNIIYFSMAVNIFKQQKAKNVMDNIFRGVMLLIIPLCMYVWPIFYYTILVDVILGFVVGYILFIYFTSGINKFNFINISLALFFLTCTKGNGLLLALICLAIIYGDMVFFRRKEWFKYLEIKKFKEIFKVELIKKIIILILPILFTLFTFLSWNICIKILDVAALSNEELGSVITAIFTEEFKERLPFFIQTTKSIYIEYKDFIFICGALYISLMGFMLKKSKKTIVRFIIVPTVFLMLTCIYILFLYSVCNTMATVEIATGALARYLYTIVAIFLFTIPIFIVYYSKQKIGLNIAIIMIMILYFTTPASWQTKKFINKDYTNESIIYREGYATINEKLNKVNPNKDIVYYIKEGEIDILVANFDVFPIQLSHMPAYREGASIEEYSNIILHNNSIELYTVNTEKEKDKLNEKREGEIYIYVYKTSDINKQLYGKIFEYNNIPMQDETLYKVENVNNIAILSIVE